MEHMSTPDFTHLHCHSEYSLLDGLARIDPLLDAAQRHGMTSLALTDHGVMFGAIEFYQAAKKRGIKPIIGVEAYVAPRSMAQREGKQDASGYHQVLLAENETGYRNLLRLTTEAQLRGYYYKPRIDKELLEKHCEGLIATSTCLSAEVPRHLLRDDLPAAKRALEWYAEHFPGRFYLELQDHQLPDQHRVNERLLELSKHYNLPLVATNDVHYINQEHSWAQEVLLCVQTGVTVDDPKRMKMDSKEFYLKPAHEMWTLFGHRPDALKSTMEIAERCTLDLEFGRVQLPEMPVPSGHTVDTYLAEVCHARLIERYGEVTDELRRRLDYELAVIRKTGFAAYFLLLDDIIGFARREGIMVGPGRGSAVGSLASYCLGITNVDPMGYDLLFERFLNPDRLSMPDIDTDFADDRRDEVIRYITRRFGADCVAQISTFGTMAAKAAVKDVGRALGIPYGDVDRVAKLIPLKTNLDGALALPDMKSLYDNDEPTKRLLDTARQLEDVKRHSSTHAAGVVISRDPLTSVTPLVRVGKEGEEGQATQYDAGVLEKVGLLKMDILGLTTLTLIQRTVRNVEQAQGVIVEPDEIPLNDPLIYQLLSAGDTAGIFQLESPPMRKVLRDMKPDRFTDIVAVVALYRPGPMNYIDQYVARKSGAERVTYLHPDLESILGNTYGIIVYQDQVLKIALEFAGFTWGDADKLRKAMGKKLVEEMKKQQDAFEAGFKSTAKWEYRQEESGEVVSHQVPKPAYPVELARAIWPLIETFAGYGFNKCLCAKTYLKLPDGTRMQLSAAYRTPPAEIMAMWLDGEIRPHKVQRIVKTGRKALVRVTTESGKVIVATPEHRLLTTEGYKRIDEMAVGLELMTAPRRVMDTMREARPATDVAWQTTDTEVSVAASRNAEMCIGSTRQLNYPGGQGEPSRHFSVRDLPCDLGQRPTPMHPDMTRNAVAAMHERVKWLWANDPAWRVELIGKSIASTRACYDTGLGYGRCSIASNGMWCASQPERDMCEWLIAQGIDFEMHKVLPGGRICDFYFAGVYWEMDGMDRAPAYFAAKYGDLPYVVVTPEDFKFVVEHHLALAHAQNGDPIVSIEAADEGQTYDVEMAPDGPLNFIANEVVSHNSHAAAYAQLACQTAYLKAKFKVEYMAASLSIETGTPDRMTVVLGECRRLGISIRPPDVNHSELDFSVEDGAVRYALQAVKNVGAGAIRSIVDARHEGGPFRDLDDFCRRVDWKFLNKRALESLVKAGAMDTLNTGGGATGLANRSLLLGNLDAICSQAQRASRAADAGQISLFAAAEDVEALGMPSITLQTAKEYMQKELLAWEKEMLGLYVSEHPLSAFLAQSSHLGTTPISTITPALAGKRVKVGAQIVGLRQILTKKNETMLVLELEDLERTIEAVAFPRTYARFRELWQEEAILLIEGNVDVRNDRLQLIVEEASVFENKVGSGAERWTINVPRSSNKERDLARLQDAYLLLQQYMPGPNRVDLMTVVDGRHVPIRLPSSDLTFNCCPELLDRVRVILGANAVEVVAAASPPPLPTPLDDLPSGEPAADWPRSTPDDPYGDMPLPVDSDADAELAYVYG